MATVYKKTTFKEIENRPIQKIDSSTSIDVQNILLSFVNYFKLKHL
jgi:hypothetical protein